MRIGGDFEIDVSMLSQMCVDGFFPMPTPYKLWVDTGRTALLISLQEIIRLGGVKKALLPAYICPSVIAPFIKLGFQLRFYSTDTLAVTPVPGDDETFLFAHYFGKKNHSIIEWVRFQQAKCNFYVIEDCVQASLNANVGETGDFVITSYRKFLPMPDGAILGSRRIVQCDILDEPDESFVSAKLIGKLLRNCGNDDLFLKTLGDAESKLEILRPRKMSWLSNYMLMRTDVQEISIIRRSNWVQLDMLLEEAGMLMYLTPIFRKLEAGDVPLGFPIIINNGLRDNFKKFLEINKIYCPIHWSLDHLKYLDNICQDAVVISSNILTLPIDQRISVHHIKYMVQTIVSYFEKGVENGE